MSYQNDNQMQQLAADTQAKLLKRLGASDLAAHEVPYSKHPDLEERVFHMASRVALQLAPQLHSSNFHTWEFFRHIESSEEAHQNAARFRKATYPFATCLDMATEAARCLIAALRQDGDLAGYANRVQVATGAITSAREVHCLAMVKFDGFCIVIDLCAQPTAFKVKLGSAYECQQQLDMLSADIHSFTYAYIKGPECARLLVDCTTYDTKPAHEFFAELAPFYEINKPVYEEFIRSAVYAKSTRQTSFGAFPSRKTIQARSLIEHEPANPFMDHFPVEGGKYISELLALRVDFVEQELTLALPYQDWLSQPANQYYLERLRGHSEFNCGVNLMAHAIAHFRLSLGTDTRLDLPLRGFTAQVMIKLQLMDDIWTALGMPKGEVLRIAHVARDVWKEAVGKETLLVQGVITGQ
jgi:hypothetical protein